MGRPRKRALFPVALSINSAADALAIPRRVIADGDQSRRASRLRGTRQTNSDHGRGPNGMGADVAASNTTESVMNMSPELIKKLQAAGMKLKRHSNGRGRRVRARRVYRGDVAEVGCRAKRNAPALFHRRGPSRFGVRRIRRRQHDGASAPNQTSGPSRRGSPSEGIGLEGYHRF